MEMKVIAELIEETKKFAETKSQIVEKFNTLFDQINQQLVNKITYKAGLKPLYFELRRIQTDDYIKIIGVELDFEEGCSLAFCKWREYDISEESGEVLYREYFNNPSDIETIHAFLSQFDEMMEYFRENLRAKTKQLSELSDLIKKIRSDRAEE